MSNQSQSQTVPFFVLLSAKRYSDTMDAVAASALASSGAVRPQRRYLKCWKLQFPKWPLEAVSESMTVPMLKCPNSQQKEVSLQSGTKNKGFNIHGVIYFITNSFELRKCSSETFRRRHPGDFHILQSLCFPGMEAIWEHSCCEVILKQHFVTSKEWINLTFALTSCVFVFSSCIHTYLIAWY